MEQLRQLRHCRRREVSVKVRVSGELPDQDVSWGGLRARCKGGLRGLSTGVRFRIKVRVRVRLGLAFCSLECSITEYIHIRVRVRVRVRVKVRGLRAFAQGGCECAGGQVY